MNNGWTQLPNLIWDRQDLTTYERSVLTHIVRKTIGWGKETDAISHSQFVKELNISKNSVRRAIDGLVEKQLIDKKSEFNCGKVTKYSIAEEIIKQTNDFDDKKSKTDTANPVFTEQGGCPHRAGGVPSQGRGGALTGQGGVPSQGHTKDTIKNTIKRKKEINKEKTFFKKFNLKNFNQEEQTFCLQLIEYRKSIQKPLKTEMGLKGLLKNINQTVNKLNLTRQQVFEKMQENEWQSINPDWITNKYSKTKTNPSFSDLKRQMEQNDDFKDVEDYTIEELRQWDKEREELNKNKKLDMQIAN